MQVVPLRRIGPAAAVVCALHCLLLWWAALPRLQADVGVPTAPVMATRWIEALRAPPPAIERVPAAVRQRATVQHTPPVTEAVNEAPAATPAPVEGGSPITPTLAPAPAEPAVRLDGVERAVRDVARRPGLAVQADAALESRPVSASQRLERGVASAVKPDCLGAERGMALGLLALPMLAIDAATGRCK